MGKQVAALTALAAAPDAADLIYIVDMSAGPAGKKITVSNLLAGVNLGSHSHAAADITSGTLAHERGGLEFNASAITTGGLIRGASAGVMSLLAVGTDGQVLTVQPDGSIAWEDAVGGALDAIELKSSVKAATTANITLSGEQTIDGVACVSGDRVLAKNQSTASQNGIYIVDAYAWTRASDMAAASNAAANFCFVQQGTANADKGFLCTNNDGAAVVGTNNLAFAQFSGGGSVNGPGSSTDNAIARWDGTGGTAIQDSSPQINDAGQILGVDSTGSFDFAFVGDEDTGMGRVAANVGQLGSGGGNRLFWYDGGVTIVGCVKQDNHVSVAGTEVDWNDGNIQQITLASSPTLTFVAPLHYDSDPKPARLVLIVKQDATGNRTITWPAAVKWAGGTAPTLTTTANRVDVIEFIFDGNGTTDHYHGRAYSLDSR